MDNSRDEIPVFEVVDIKNGHHRYKVYASGHIEGFSEGCIIINAIGAFENLAIRDFCEARKIA